MQRFLSHWFQTPQVSDQSLEISSDMPEKATTPDDGKVISTTTFPYGGILGPRSPSVIDFPFGGSAEDAIKEWPTLSNAATLKYVRFFS